jgi:hypothetical protein
MAERHVRAAKSLQSKAVKRLAKMDPTELKPRDALDLFIQAAKLERLALGEPTESTDITDNGQGVPTITFIEMPGVDTSEDQTPFGSPAAMVGQA